MSGPHEREAGDARARRPVLVADDDPDVRVALAALLDHMGLPCETVSDGAAAVRRLRSGGLYPRLVLLDLLMEDASATETLRSIRAAAPTIPILVMSGLDRAHAVSHLGGARVEGVLQKPIRLADLRATLPALLDAPGDETR